jgi:hypothetical protein
MSSKIVAIKRRRNTSNIPANLYEESKKKIGSYFTPTGDIGSGLTIEEERKYMPRILGITASDVTYHKLVKEYFANLTVEVLAAGTSLEVGLDEEGEPLNLNDWLKYKFCAKNPEVAPDEASSGSVKYMFFIHDATAKLEADFEQLKGKKDAYKEFIKLSANEDKLTMVMNVCGIDSSKMDEKTRELQMEKFVVDNPAKFIAILKDPNLEHKAFIENCVRHSVLRRVGTSILNGDERLGGTIDEAIEYFKDKTHSETVTVLKARLSEFKS